MNFHLIPRLKKSMNKINSIISLLKIKGFGNVKVKSLLEFIGNDQYDNSNDLKNLISEFSEKVKKTKIPSINELEIAIDNSKMIIDECLNKNINIMGYSDLDFPNSLKSINNGPVILYTKGKEKLIKNQKLICIIGTREPTKTAIKLGENLSKTVIDNNYKIVSGLALGCDTIAHKTSVNNDSETIAVLPSSVEEVYPKENRKLADKILDKNGLIISEYEPGSILTKNKYIERNRIVSGISKGVCVIQCNIKSGTMRTVDSAIKQNKKIGAINYSFTNKIREYEGNDFLINKSNYSLGNKEEILVFLKSLDDLEPKNSNIIQTELF